MSPRPILKRTPSSFDRAPKSSNDHPHHAVHFPPTSCPTTHTYQVYSSTAYDRSPIVVSPNTCALPARGCPGRTYNLEEHEPQTLRRYQFGSHEAHPRAFALQRADAGRQSTPSYHIPPPLIPDLSSESDESDGFSSSSFTETPIPYASYAPPDMHGLVIPKDKYLSYQQYESNPHDNENYSPSALSFLPYPPSPPSRACYDYNPASDSDVDLGKPRRRRERRHDSSRSPDRIPSGVDERSQSPSTPTKSRSKSRISAFRKSLCTTPSTFRVEDDSCLGGF
jgi:hypothetical protein